MDCIKISTNLYLKFKRIAIKVNQRIHLTQNCFTAVQPLSVIANLVRFDSQQRRLHPHVVVAEVFALHPHDDKLT